MSTTNCQTVSTALLVCKAEVDPNRVTTAMLVYKAAVDLKSQQGITIVTLLCWYSQKHSQLFRCTCSLVTFRSKLEVEVEHNLWPKGGHCSVSMQCLGGYQKGNNRCVSLQVTTTLLVSNAELEPKIVTPAVLVSKTAEVDSTWSSIALCPQDSVCTKHVQEI